ncbi:hypothetical protein QIP24_gp4 [ssRNA phage Esthiorhiza.2_1]|uniref:Uncharacterized protein n=1 Tax=ssRNA phage Esthiorhiza.2_1 TaxID=2786025 RepID=A0A8S5KY28_9VIRU|nr:hypothetical protein QIP24_gp4 [ssRNA phage Esthiorhiza.2_1]DAD49949.1 TPA_asm: hypothetical protein [ssRNA phage Esthiorhiza.2_1]
MYRRSYGDLSPALREAFEVCRLANAKWCSNPDHGTRYLPNRLADEYVVIHDIVADRYLEVSELRDN